MQVAGCSYSRTEALQIVSDFSSPGSPFRFYSHTAFAVYPIQVISTLFSV
jgi:hypothetical protein